MRRPLKIALMGVATLLTLTACDPPIPESLLVAQAEQQIQCGEPGELDVYVDYSFVDLGYTWAGIASENCPELIANVVEFSEDADLIISASPAQCEPLASAPVAFDAASIVFYLDEAFALNLSAEAIQGIFSGEITNWSDEAITRDNPDVELPDLEIMVQPESIQAAISAMEAWTAGLTGESVSFSLLQDDPTAYLSDLAFEYEQGTIGLIPKSDALVAGMTPVNIALADGSFIVSEQQSIYSGGTKFGFSREENKVVATYDANIPARPSPGTSGVAVPYEALYPVDLTICGEDNLVKRAFARYVVRLDAQGVVATTALLALGEDIRIASASVLGKGLPQPEVVVTEE